MRFCLLLVPVLAIAQQVPAGAEISVRLTNSVSSRTSKPADPVDAVVIAPVIANGRASIAAGAVVHGKVEKVTPALEPDQRAALQLVFNEIIIADRAQRIAAQVSAVDNAREKVDEQGQINGILASETITGKLDAELDKLSDQYSGFASILSTAKNAVLEKASADIAYSPGVEMTIKLVEPLAVPPMQIPGPPEWPGGDRHRLAALIAREPFQTTAKEPPKPSDLINLEIIATEDDLRRAFTEAGWSGATSLNPVSKFETLRALAEDRGYNEAPVSILLLDGKPPDLVFEKTTDTFARRHHLRVWRRPGVIHGKPVWAVAATHDIGIDFSDAQRNFIHRIDSQIDREREKVVNDLVFTGRVKAFVLVDRLQAPREAQNATGDRMETDGRIAVLLLD